MTIAWIQGCLLTRVVNQARLNDEAERRQQVQRQAGSQQVGGTINTFSLGSATRHHPQPLAVPTPDTSTTPPPSSSTVNKDTDESWINWIGSWLGWKWFVEKCGTQLSYSFVSLHDNLFVYLHYNSVLWFFFINIFIAQTEGVVIGSSVY